MANLELFQERIGYQGNLVPLLEQVCSDYQFGHYRHHGIVLVGYEDFNVRLTSDRSEFFVKIFASTRPAHEPQRYVDITTKAIDVGVNHPRLFQSDKGYLDEVPIEDTTLKLCVMEFVDGQTFYESATKPNNEEIKDLTRQAAKINSLSFKPPYCYDSWAVVNLLREYEITNPHLLAPDQELLRPLVEEFDSLKLATLPHCLVHGDIIETNVIKGKQGKLYIIDFSVANYYPRIQELAVLFCDLFFNQQDPSGFSKTYGEVLEEYQKQISLTPEELNILPFYIRAAHAMHLICATREKAMNGNNSEENEHFFQMGRFGLRFTTALWK